MGPTTFTRSFWPALKIHWAPAAVLALGILGTVLAAYSVALMSNSREKLRFRNNARWMEGLIRERLDIYVSVLNSTAAMFSIHEQPTAEEFRAYAQRLALDEHFPGAQGVGFARRTLPEETDRVTPPR